MEYLRRMSVIWTSPLSNHNRVSASNQFALPVLGYLMWTRTVADNGYRERLLLRTAKRYPCGSNAIFYLPRDRGEGGGEVGAELYFR